MRTEWLLVLEQGDLTAWVDTVGKEANPGRDTSPILTPKTLSIWLMRKMRLQLLRMGVRRAQIAIIVDVANPVQEANTGLEASPGLPQKFLSIRLARETLLLTLGQGGLRALIVVVVDEANLVQEANSHQGLSRIQEASPALEASPVQDANPAPLRTKAKTRSTPSLLIGTVNLFRTMKLMGVKHLWHRVAM